MQAVRLAKIGICRARPTGAETSMPVRVDCEGFMSDRQSPAGGMAVSVGYCREAVVVAEADRKTQK